VAPDGTETTLYIFSGGSDGGYPEAGLVMDKDGNLYGTTSEGGSGAHCGQEEYNCGTVFLLSSGGSLTTLHAFCSRNLCQDGASPVANLIADAKGNLYGTAWEGRVSGDGVVFEITR
jgi:uncharacterized repeat protein (TIGR03803 family)